MTAAFDDSEWAEPTRRFYAVRFVARIVLVVAVPVAALGAALWWTVANDRVDRTIDLQAASNHRAVALALGDHLGAKDNRIIVDDDVGLADGRHQMLEPLVGSVELRIIDPAGKIVASDVDGEVGVVVALTEEDREAFQGIPTGVRVTGISASTVAYSLPWAPPGGSTVGVIQLTVLDDRVVDATVDDVGDLGWLFGGAFFALLIALGPLCLWSLGAVRGQLRRTRVMALNDQLTGLGNRVHFQDRLDEAIAGAQRGDGQVGLVMVDLDGFKAINDTGGHAAGDRLLKRVAAGLQEATRRNEVACRLGGDEFAVVVPRLASREALVALADRLHERLDLDVPFSDGRTLRITASMGLAVFPQDADNADDLVNTADRGMYGVKAARRAKLPPSTSGAPVSLR
jgi:diguanylate cyclase (GGDEF)-like protein